MEGRQQHREQAWESNHGLWEGATEEGWSERDVRGEHLQGPVAPSHLSPPSISIKNDYSLFRSDLPPTSLSARFFFAHTASPFQLIIAKEPQGAAFAVLARVCHFLSIPSCSPLGPCLVQ